MATSDSPEFRFGGLRGNTIEELPRFHLPAPQVLTQDPRLQIVRKLLDPNRLTVTPEAQRLADICVACTEKVRDAVAKLESMDNADAPATRIGGAWQREGWAGEQGA